VTYHPQAQELIDAMAESGAPPLTEMTAEEARELPAIVMETVGPGPDVAVVRDIEIPGPAGAIPARGLAPEHFPAATEDAFVALVWLSDQHPDSRIVVAGDSASGNLAAVAALRAREAGGPEIALQVSSS